MRVARSCLCLALSLVGCSRTASHRQDLGNVPSHDLSLAEPPDDMAAPSQPGADLAVADLASPSLPSHDMGTGAAGVCHGWCWLSPAPTGNTILALSSAGSQVWAVTRQSILHWDGSAWTTWIAPAGLTLVSIAAVSDDDVWALGVTQNAPSVGATLHWNGATWKRVANPSVGVLSAIAASASDDVWAVGASGAGNQAAAIHWDGKLWSTATLPAFGPLVSVWPSGPGDVWAGVQGNGLIHFDGATWSGGWSPVTSSVGGFWGASSSDVWAIGGNTTPLWWNGTNWTTKGSVSPQLLLSSSWGTSDANVWFSGVARWTGSLSSGLGFTETSAAGEVGAVISGSSAGDIWAGNTQLWHYDGNRWLFATQPASPVIIRQGCSVGQTALGEGLLLYPSNAAPPFAAIPWTRLPTGTNKPLNVAASGKTGFWLLGDGGTIQLAAGANPPFTALKFVTVASPTTANLRGVYDSALPNFGSDVRFIVGDGGTSLVWDGSNWVKETSPTTANLRGIWASYPGQIWAFGDGPTLLQRDATTANLGSWSAVTLPATSATSLGAAAGTGASDVWLGGDAGTILHYDGKTWSVTPSGTSAVITGLVTTGVGAVYASTSAGEVLSWSGAAWTTLQAATGHALVGIAATSQPTTVTVCDSSHLWTWDTTSWMPTPIQQPRHTRGAWAGSASDAWLVGSFGAGNAGPAAGFALHFDGSAWQLVTDGRWNTLRAVAATTTHRWLFGDDGIFDSAGGKLTLTTPAAGNGYSAAHVADDTHAWAIGGSTGLAQWNGASWTAVAPPAGKALNDLTGSGAGDVWGLSTGTGTPLLYHWDGASWTAKTVPPTAKVGAFSPSHVWSEQPGIVWLVGANALFRGDGTSWTTHQPADAGSPAFKNPPSGYYFMDVGGRSPTDIWAAGYDGLAYHFDGASWTTVGTAGDRLDEARFHATPAGLILTTAAGALVQTP